MKRLRELLLIVVAAWCVVVSCGGCSARSPINPSFNVEASAAHHALRRMKVEPTRLDRPVFILGGLHDPGFVSDGLVSRMRPLFHDDATLVPISFMGCGSFDECRERFVAAVRTVLDNDQSKDGASIDDRSVDVVAFSMGGLVARYASLPRTDGEPHVRIERLFTVSTPHRGALMAEWPTTDERALDMRSGSAFLTMLDHAWHEDHYELVSYVRLGDSVVGAEHAAAPDGGVYWVATPLLSFAHLWACRDPRIVADIAARLRGDPPLTQGPPAPLPTN